ncbi:MAG: thioredoxin [Bacteroidales bacterium]|jgi:thioredoxin 1|nr:thioredoxin [Bacteroidales bacterium]
MALEINDSNFEEIVLQSDKLAVVDFWAQWCGPCRMVAPIIEELSDEYDGQIVIGKCDVDSNSDSAVKFGIRNIPTVLFFKGGEVVDKLVGAATKSAFADKIEALK